MLNMVIENPRQLTMVSAVPFISAGAFWATIVDKSGESATTTIPQKTRKAMNKLDCAVPKTNGEVKQQRPDKNKAMAATLRVPIF